MAGSSTDTLSPTEVGALSVAVHPAVGSCLSLYLASAGGQAWSLQLVLRTDTLSPADVGALLVAVHLATGSCLSLYRTHGLALFMLLVRQLAAEYHSSINIPLPCLW